MKGYNFIITGLQSWDIPVGSNAVDIAKEIARDNRVLYVNSPLDCMTLLRNTPGPENVYRREVLKRKQQPLRRIHENLWVLDCPFFIWSVNGLPDGFLFDAVNRQNNRRICRYIKEVSTSLGFDDVIHFIDNDVYRSFYAKEMMGARMHVYYRRDNLHPFPYWSKHIGRLEPGLISKSDLVVCNSPQLAAYAKKYNPHSYDVGQGVDLTAYHAASAFSLPSPFKNIPGPRIGYIGDINSMRLDADLLHDLAESMPQYHFVMVGSEDAVFKAHRLHSLPNVHFTGRIDKTEVPRYMAALQVCINPQVVNQVTIGNYPRKVDEYLAMGKPVVATHTPAMDMFRDHVYLCRNAGEYRDALERALRENTVQQEQARIAFARSHSWENNVNMIYQLIQEHLK